MSGLTAVSLFSGIGGFELAMQSAGVRTVLSCEKDKAARGVLADRFDHVIHNDVTRLTADDCLRAGFVPERGIVTAGWPCQGNSVAGLRKGMDDARSGLWVPVARLLAELRPRWFIGENVPGLLSVNGGRDFATVLRDLAGVGMGVAWRVLDAQHFGVPQRRRRVVIIGCAGDRGAPVEVLFEPEGVRGDFTAGGETRPGVAATLTAGSASRGISAPGRRSEDDVNLVVSTLQAGGGDRGWRLDAEAAAGGHLIEGSW